MKPCGMCRWLGNPRLRTYPPVCTNCVARRAYAARPRSIEWGGVNVPIHYDRNADRPYFINTGIVTSKDRQEDDPEWWW